MQRCKMASPRPPRVVGPDSGAARSVTPQHADVTVARPNPRGRGQVAAAWPPLRAFGQYMVPSAHIPPHHIIKRTTSLRITPRRITSRLGTLSRMRHSLSHQTTPDAAHHTTHDTSLQDMMRCRAMPPPFTLHRTALQRIWTVSACSVAEEGQGGRLLSWASASKDGARMLNKNHSAAIEVFAPWRSNST